MTSADHTVVYIAGMPMPVQDLHYRIEEDLIDNDTRMQDSQSAYEKVMREAHDAPNKNAWEFPCNYCTPAQYLDTEGLPRSCCYMCRRGKFNV